MTTGAYLPSVKAIDCHHLATQTPVSRPVDRQDERRYPEPTGRTDGAELVAIAAPEAPVWGSCKDGVEVETRAVTVWRQKRFLWSLRTSSVPMAAAMLPPPEVSPDSRPEPHAPCYADHSIVAMKHTPAVCVSRHRRLYGSSSPCQLWRIRILPVTGFVASYCASATGVAGVEPRYFSPKFFAIS